MFFSLTIDLDPAWCYRRIYGLAEEQKDTDGMVAPAVERFCQLADELGLRGTLFVVGRSLQDKKAAEAVAQAARRGHELACHSFAHDYCFSQWPPERMEEDVRCANRAISELAGREPAGFRAPGYLLGPRTIGVLESLGMKYDSSILPAPAYQGTKAAVRAWLKMQGRQSGSAPANLRESLAPSRPYRPDPQAPWRRGSARLLELPVGTLLGAPLLGGLFALAGPARAAWLGALARQKAWVNLELHAADLVDIASDGLAPELGVQPDLKIPWQRKAESVLVFCRALLSSHRALSLAEVARLLSPATGGTP